ncbi:cytochrome c oxidase assembly protein [Mesorhizobium sp.]|uniref:cytochrome c oxidase assembly protein n=1 Tax=Mesorhizobium sp. TaxID=1871066 RepID=UPI0025DB237E|nr:cytochrome c oxidase assembly protein [Mesorhizobium sp.]
MSHFIPLAGVTLAFGLYAVGAARLWRRAGLVRGLKRSEAAFGVAGFVVLAGVLLSPLHHYSGQVFSAHMIEHELLMAVAAPLIVLGSPLFAMLWAFSRIWRQRLGSVAVSAPVVAAWRWLRRPLVTTVLHGLAIWVWHLPGPFTNALAFEPVHWLQHASFLLSALLFWSSLLRVAAPGASLFYVFATATHSGILGALLTFSGRAWYPPVAPGLWGLTAMEDQQLAGLIMWIPVNLAYLTAALLLAAHWLGTEPREALR